MRAPRGSCIGSGDNIPSSGVGAEQPKGVRMDKPMGTNHMCVCLSVRGCEGEGLCLWTEEQPAWGSLHTGPVCHVLPSPGTASPAAQGLSFPPIQTPQLLESTLAGHNYQLDSCTLVFCVAVVWVGFSPCPYYVFECTCCETSSNTSALKAAELWQCGYV